MILKMKRGWVVVGTTGKVGIKQRTVYTKAPSRISSGNDRLLYSSRTTADRKRSELEKWRRKYNNCNDETFETIEAILTISTID